VPGSAAQASESVGAVIQDVHGPTAVNSEVRAQQQPPPVPAAPVPAPHVEGQQPRPPPELEEMVGEMVRQANEHQHALWSSPRPFEYKDEERHTQAPLNKKSVLTTAAGTKASAKSAGSTQSSVASRSTQSAGSAKTNASAASTGTSKAKQMALNMARLSDMFNAIEEMTVFHEDGKISFCERFRTDSRFRGMVSDTIMGLVVLLNIAMMGASADLCPDCSSWFVIDTLFAMIFLVELVTKLLTSGISVFLCGPDRWWNIFEASLVFLALAEVVMGFIALVGNAGSGAGPGMALFRLIRVFRITRVLRVCRLELFSELMVMIKGTMGGARTLMWSIVLISLPLYAVALLLRETVGNMDPKLEEESIVEMFSSVGTSFFALFSCIVSGECSEASGRPIFLLLSKHFGGHYALLFCIVSMFMTFGLFNVIVAIFVENVVAAARTNEASKKQAHMRDQVFFAQKLVELLEVIWDLLGKKHEGSPQELLEAAKEGFSLTPDAFEQLRQNSHFSAILEQLDIPVEDQYALFETLDGDQSGVIDFDELIGGIHMLRGEARRSDIIAVNIHVVALQNQFQHFIKKFDEFSSQHHFQFSKPRVATVVNETRAAD